MSWNLLRVSQVGLFLGLLLLMHASRPSVLGAQSPPSKGGKPAPGAPAEKARSDAAGATNSSSSAALVDSVRVTVEPLPSRINVSDSLNVLVRITSGRQAIQLSSIRVTVTPGDFVAMRSERQTPWLTKSLRGDVAAGEQREVEIQVPRLFDGMLEDSKESKGWSVTRAVSILGWAAGSYSVNADLEYRRVGDEDSVCRRVEGTGNVEIRVPFLAVWIGAVVGSVLLALLYNAATLVGSQEVGKAYARPLCVLWQGVAVSTIVLIITQRTDYWQSPTKVDLSDFMGGTTLGLMSDVFAAALYRLLLNPAQSGTKDNVPAGRESTQRPAASRAPVVSSSDDQQPQSGTASPKNLFRGH